MIFDFVFCFFIVFVCGVVIGFECQMCQCMVGLCIIMFVVSGVCLFVMFGVLIGNGVVGVMQIVVYVVLGVGFFGGGVIMCDKGLIQGINMVVMLWCLVVVGVLVGFGYYVFVFVGMGVVLFINMVLCGVSQVINVMFVFNVDFVCEYQIIVICFVVDEVYICMLLLNVMYVKLLLFQSFMSEDVFDQLDWLKVIVMLKLYLKDQQKFEQIVSWMSMEKSIFSVSWIVKEVELMME